MICSNKVWYSIVSFRLPKVLRDSMGFSKLGRCCRPASWGLCVNITYPPQAHYQGEHIMQRAVVYLKLQLGLACTWPPSHLNDVKPQAPHRCRHSLALSAWLEQAPHPRQTQTSACKRVGPCLQNASLMHLGPRQALRLSDQSCCALLNPTDVLCSAPLMCCHGLWHPQASCKVVPCFRMLFMVLQLGLVSVLSGLCLWVQSVGACVQYMLDVGSCVGHVVGCVCTIQGTRGFHHKRFKP